MDNNNNRVLVIMASGTSSRFGGFPKAFCQIHGITNVEHTINVMKDLFEYIYVVVNKEISVKEYITDLDAQIIRIVTGQGDADSILKSLRIISANEQIDEVFLCWGDAVFLSDLPVRELLSKNGEWSEESPVCVACSQDNTPYAWFDLEENQIVESHFAKDEGYAPESAVHDQSLFRIRVPKFIKFIEKYKNFLGLDIYDEETYDKKRGEMSILKSFTYFSQTEGCDRAEICMVTKGCVKSFNTIDELNEIRGNS